ncbi:peptidylprolyl isomerase [Kribbella antibiotica]|uniref:Peptidyl-prolyl cis-trans isomerase n=1 Tax=Kribbella antibiotica TaxID=190195 RepID=A0A4R4ZNI4_9ACTN|nr:peptidylprolyl isomerase [Kribbella antibiotica]TDD60441.1 peptidylprolyl isomerase [Kribbella antibiotica]
MSKRTHEQQLAARKAKRQAERQAERSRQRRNLAVTVTAVVAVVAVLVGVFVLFGPKGSNDTPAAGDTPPTDAPAVPDGKPKSIPTALAPAPKRATALPAEVNCTYKKGAEPASKKVDPPSDGKIKASGTSKVSLNTSVGDLQVTLDSALAPCTVKNFLSLVGQKYFADTTCHRLTVGEGLQVLQCGDPTKDEAKQGSGGPGYSFADEVYPTLKYGRGILAMANSGPNTNGSQFFIVYGDASGLGPQYTAFGTLDEPSLKLIDKVANAGVKPKNGPTDGSPVTPVKINTATAAA